MDTTSMQRPTFTLADLLVEQEKLEAESISQGAEQFFARLNKTIEKGQYGESAPVQGLLRHGIQPLTEALTRWMERQPKGRPHTATKWVQAVGIDAAAYLALRVVLDGLLEPRHEADVARRIATLIVDELRWRKIKAEAPQAVESNLRKFAESNTVSYSHRANVMLKTAKVKGVDLTGITMSETDKIHVGYKLLDVVQHVTGLVESVTELETSGRGCTTHKLLVCDPQTREWLTARTDRLAALATMTLPMVVPPVEWGSDSIGGYRYGMRARFPMVRRERPDKALPQGEIRPVYDALNAAQNTSWRINLRVYGVLKHYLDHGINPPGIEIEHRALPSRPAVLNEEVTDENREAHEAARKQYRQEAAPVHRENHVRKQTRRWLLESVLPVVERVAQYPALHWVHTLDFRGRLYPIAGSGLHPQGPDTVRGLLEFSQAVPVGESGRKWTAIHLCNTYGKTPEGIKTNKFTMEERVEWVERHTPQILAVADDPIANSWWQGAEEPWQCLAACLEWAGVVREGVSYASRLPVAIDGSNNGVQHLAAAVRDKVAGEAVNLTASSLPRDIYSDVSDGVKRICSEIAAGSAPVRLQKIVEKQAEHGFAATWLSSGLIGRSLTKRPTMTVAYGSRVYGWSSQISEWLLGERATHHFIVPPTEPGERPLSLVGAAAGWMATVMMEAMGDKIRGPLAAMDWMQKCAMMVAREERPIEWTVPLTGWRVRQAYYQTEDRRVKTVLAGNVVKPVVSEETDDLDIVRQRNAIAPNVVHSLDAACLMLAVDQAAAEGVSAFGLIHDSYATHAANMDVLARAARSAFVRLYTEPVLDRLREQFATQTAEELPPVPPMGDLDLGQVHASTFFFA